MSVLWLAETLGKFVHEVEELTTDQLAEYMAYFKIKADEQKKEAKRNQTPKTPTKGRRKR